MDIFLVIIASNQEHINPLEEFKMLYFFSFVSQKIWRVS
jgi:hypothetical protein